MKGPLEKNIEQQLAGFTIEPSPHIWTEVEKNLHPHRKDRGVFWWWVLPLGISVSSMFFWIVNPFTGNQEKIIIPGKSETKDITKQRPLISDSTSAISPAQIEKTGRGSVLTKKTNQISHSFTGNPKEINRVKEQENMFTIQDTPLLKQSESPKKNVGLTEEKTYPAVKDQAGKIPVNKLDSLLIAKDTVFKKQANTLKITSLKKGKWFFTAEGGIINVKGTNLFHSSVNYPAYSGNNATTPGGTQQIFTTSPQTGFQFTAGLRYHKILSKQFSAETGLQYHYIQNKQYTGNKDITGMYYLPGNSLLLTNHAQILELPVFIKMYLNPDKTNPIYLLTGISAEWLFQKKWLITDYTMNNYYYDPSSLKNLQLKLSGGVGIQFKNDINAVIKFSQGISPFYQKNNIKQFKQEYSAGLLIPLQYSIHRTIKK